jgi:hypothetical protein
MAMTPKKRLAARYLAGGLPAKDIMRQLNIPASTMRIWLAEFRFKRYVMKIEQRYLATIDNELVALKMVAFRVLRDAMEQTRDTQHRQWAVNKIFQVENFKDTAKQSKNTEVNTYIGGEAFHTKEQKDLGKTLLKLYRGGKVDDVVTEVS